ncbi:ATP-binding cassette sub-family G member 1 [Ctenocephalides felis]|uniref:ATP-binding cassette sub-family G member 1 n=1 Tax=Ctenocephalides felis TaxID=7515 RepID=UPI000E6E3048|nr:ATP-binding cassette sub-family G member 1 [Ctenocephalides felis]
MSPNKSDSGCCMGPSCSSEASTSSAASSHSSLRRDNNNVELSMRNVRPVDIRFKDVRYQVLEMSLTKLRVGHKEILHGVSGHFRAGQLTAIMGPSGAGKSTLLNVLAGYICRGVSGTIEMKDVQPANDEESETQHIKKDKSSSCRYIHQDDKLRPWLTVQEAMSLAAALKLDKDAPKRVRDQRIKELLSALGLSDHVNTQTGRLSGGQRKRLSIALEMISDPAVLFLDEPTTGLDSSSCTQCITLLRSLARQGRTVVCTVHQPSALLFERFDQIYVLVEGHAFYRGSPLAVQPFLSATTGLRCPQYHNPADFMMEVATGDYGADLSNIISACSKLYALQEEQEKFEMQGIEGSEKVALLKEVESLGGNVDIELASQVFKGDFVNNRKSLRKQQAEQKPIRPPSFLTQFWLLYKRQLLGERRNYSMPLLRLVAHMLIGVLFGYLYRNVGNDADSALGNYIYLYGTMLLLVYTGKMSVTLNFPLEMETLAREHFNRWYNLAPYYLSVILFEIPFQILCTLVYVACSYYLTGNLLDWFRIGCFVSITILGSLCGQSWGYFIGASTPVKIAVFLGPVVAVLFSVFGFCLWYADIPYALKWLFHLSYFRAGFQGLVISTYGFNRTTLPCPEDKLYCHYKYTKRFLMEADATDVVLSDNLWFVSGTIFVMHALTVVVIWMKLNKR